MGRASPRGRASDRRISSRRAWQRAQASARTRRLHAALDATMTFIGAATPAAPVPVAGMTRRRAAGTGAERTPSRLLQAVGALGLVGVLACLLILCADAAAKPSEVVPARVGGWPDWLAG